MKKTYFTSLLLSVFLFSCSSEECIPTTDELTEEPIVENMEGVAIELTEEETAILEAVERFSYHFINEYAKQVEKDNYCISPLGVSSVMSMLLNGAESTTYIQLQNVLGYEDFELNSVNAYFQKLYEGLKNVDPSSSCLNANSLWTKEGFSLLSDFVKTNELYYDAVLKDNQPFNTETVEVVNSWCEEKTNGKITEFISSSEITDLKVLLLNALYFRGKWLSPFSKENTQNRSFQLVDGSSVEVPTMYIENKAALGGQNDEVTLVSLGFGNGSFFAYFFLPTDPHNSIDNILSNLSQEKWEEWKNDIRICELQLSLPRFTITGGCQLKGILNAMGITDLFTDIADLSKMSDNLVYLNTIKQMTSFTVDEEGVEGSAVTGSGLISASGGLSILQVDFNRPFGFILSEISTGTILFAGKVGNPVIE